MAVFRNILAWTVLATYLFANTFAAALHDHGDGCGHSAAGHRHQDRHCAGAHCHDSDDTTSHDDAEDADALDAPHSCAVCEYLAHAPLKAPVAALTPSGNLLPDTVVHSVERLANAAPDTHLARGPPAS
jgi:hypothetical protein